MSIWLKLKPKHKYRMNKVKLDTNYQISPVIKGGWQLSSGHSLNKKIEENTAVADTIKFIESGISTLDFGDIYTGVEKLVGKAIAELIEKYGDQGRNQVQLHTKYVPNEFDLDDFNRSDVQKIVNRSLERLGVETVDLVQFHWWKYEAKHYLEAMEELFNLKALGKIRHIGVTNFDVERLSQMVDAGLKPSSIQLQYSLIDSRAEEGMSDFCEKHGIGMICYGTVAGGFFSERYLGIKEPTVFETRSNVKYRLIIEEFGGWKIFQRLLQVLSTIASNHKTDIGTVASAYILNQPSVKAVIIGARNTDHLKSNLSIPLIQFTVEELDLLKEIKSQRKGPTGPVYHLERYDQKHRNIMHTNNN